MEAEQLVELYGAAPDRIAIVAPGVDHAFFSPGAQAQARRAVGLPSGDPVVLFAGRIQPLKGLTVAVDALAELRATGLTSAMLVVLGGPSGPHGEEELAAVHRRVDGHGLDGSVRMLPPQRHEMLSSYYRAADVCVVPSHSESFGLVALEAAACGVPVVAAAVGGLTTLVDRRAHRLSRRGPRPGRLRPSAGCHPDRPAARRPPGRAGGRPGPGLHLGGSRPGAVGPGRGADGLGPGALRVAAAERRRPAARPDPCRARGAPVRSPMPSPRGRLGVTFVRGSTNRRSRALLGPAAPVPPPDGRRAEARSGPAAMSPGMTRPR